MSCRSRNFGLLGISILHHALYSLLCGTVHALRESLQKEKVSVSFYTVPSIAHNIAAEL